VVVRGLPDGHQGLLRLQLSVLDAHQHAADPGAWARARTAGITAAVLAGVGPSDWDPMAAAAGRDRVWCAGLHPWWVRDAPEATVSAALDALADRLDRGGPVAVGECGLDHARTRDAHGRARQREALHAQLCLARDHGLPVVLHVVRATAAARAAVAAVGLPQGGLVHGFTGALEVGREWHRAGFLLGVGAAVHRSRRLQATVAALPEAALVLESDAADPATTLPGVRDAVARLRREDPHHTARYTEANARRLFGLPGRSA